MATLADDLLRLVQGTDGRACTTWTRLHNFFFANRSSRYVYLSKKFQTTPRGDLSISAYAGRLQSITDDLANIGYPVADPDLMTHLLAGLGKKFKLPSALIQHSNPFPSFENACSRLLLAEASLAEEERDEGAQVLVVHGPSQDRGQGGVGRDGGQHSGGNRGGGQHSGGDCGQYGRGARGSAPHVGYPSGVSPNYRAGVLGPRPGAPSQAYSAIHYGGTPHPSFSSSAPPYSFDHATMLHQAMSNSNTSYSQQPPEWFMDSGATSHVTV
ncbi:hypothetical protein QYE76_004207 [Lolium multiflorum]|uniref:Uncharacterized protein n=1 Tax=Lolium multiflorum TaxID=4521 RepID=A0AAD8RSS2_LOLMU|nr:hypothetical protein QYE76_004207 [Lolium multiflorum]